MTQQLKRELGPFGAVMMGLGSIVGTGVFVSIGVAAGVAGPSVVLAVILGAFVATFNGLSSAQLAAHHPVSGGTYEYGYRFLCPILGFSAGWLFLIAKSASAATAALGFAGYLLALLGLDGRGLLVPLGLLALLALTLLVLSGLQRSSLANALIVSATLASLALFVVFGLPVALERSSLTFADPFGAEFGGSTGLRGLLEATALMFVAYTGYGRIATLGEEVRDPLRTIPRAIVLTLLATMVLYGLVTFVAVGAAGSAVLADPAHRAAPLEVAAESFGWSALPGLVAAGAITAMLGVLLNLILGLSRVLLAMGRRRDMPGVFARLNSSGNPSFAVLGVSLVIALLALTGDVKTTWSFSAFTVLLYYAITNLAALALPSEARLFPRWSAYAGLIACAGLAFFVEPRVWLVGLGLVGLGVLWHAVARRLRAGP